jgi:hypothetical protein
MRKAAACADRLRSDRRWMQPAVQIIETALSAGRFAAASANIAKDSDRDSCTATRSDFTGVESGAQINGRCRHREVAHHQWKLSTRYSTHRLSSCFRFVPVSGKHIQFHRITFDQDQLRSAFSLSESI